MRWDNRPVERLVPKWDNKKSYLQLRKEKKVTFYDDTPNIKTEMNHNLLTQEIENSKRMWYSDQIVRLISRVIKDFKNNTMKKGTRLAQEYFLNKGFKKVWMRRALCANQEGGPTLYADLFFTYSDWRINATGEEKG